MRTVSKLSCSLGLALLLSVLSLRAHAETVLITGANQGIGLEL